MTADELKQIRNERDEMEKHMTDMFDLAFMINNHDDLAKSQEHHEKLSRMVTHYMGSIQQSYGYMSEKAIKSLEQGNVLDKIKGYIDYVRNTGMGKKKSLEFIEKFIEGLKTESEGKE